MSRLIAPMLATAGPPPDGDRPWSFEMKYDGCRLLASVGGGREPELWTRNLNLVTASFPEVADALSTGIVAKRSNSIYLPGQRHRSWIKTAIRTRGTVLAVGFVGSSRSVAALVLGAYNADGQLEQVGHVSSGLSLSARRQFREELRPLERPTSPLADSSAGRGGLHRGAVADTGHGDRGRFQRETGGIASDATLRITWTGTSALLKRA